MFTFGKKKQRGIYLDHQNDTLAISSEYRAFTLPHFDDEEMMRRLDERVELLTSKIDDGELDSANVDLIELAFKPLLSELEAYIEAYQTSCRIELENFRASLASRVMTYEEALSSARELAQKYAD